jgi:hypothetical protein
VIKCRGGDAEKKKYKKNIELRTATIAANTTFVCQRDNDSCDPKEERERKRRKKNK